MVRRVMLVSLVLCVLSYLPSASQAATMVGGLRCEYLSNPLGIDAVRPRLSWVITSDRRGERQTAWQVLVASSPQLLAEDRGDLWDSGRVASDQSIQVEYAGKPLTSQMRCHWKVRVWDRDGKPSAWSEPAIWSMGLLALTDWQGQWIGYDAAYQSSPDDALFTIQSLKWVRFPQKQAKAGVYTTFFRKRIDLPADRPIRRAVLALYAFNSCDAAVNGKAIGQAVHWDRTARLDATAALQAGANVVTLAARHSDNYSPAVIGRLIVQFGSGNDLVVPIDNTWKASQEAAGDWDKASFDDKEWPAAEVFDNTPWNGPPPVADLARIPAPYLRKDFAVAQGIKRATVYVTALGAYELHLNGKRVGKDVLTPGWTEFRKRVHYQTYDVTAQVASGANTLAAILGDGWYASDLAHLAKRNVYGGRPRLLVQLVIELVDGSTQTIVSDGTWKAAYGPIRHADLLMGCEYDARLLMPGWDAVGFDDRDWKPVVTEGLTDRKIQAAVAEPSRVIQELPARKLTEPKPGCWTFDLGQNMVGWVRLKVRGAAGQRITVRHGEMLNSDGTIYTAALRSCPAADFYVLSGKGEEILEPYFTFHGFRYVEVRGLMTKPELDAMTGVVVHTDMRRTGSFECSSPLINQLYSNIIWGQKGNYLEVPTDCPQRDERMGWTGDTQFFAPTAAYNFDVAAFFTRWLTTCRDNQFPDGTFPHVVPDIMGGGGATAWGDAALLCAYNIYRAYGDTRLLSEHFASMDRYMRWLAGKTKNGISEVGGFEDWLNAGGGANSKAIDTAYHAHLARIMSEMAQALGRNEDAQRYAKLHEEVKAAFVKAFLQSDGSLKDCSQTGYALAFSMGLLPEDMREKAAAKYVEEIKRFDWHLATGFIGTPRLLPGLHAAGRDDVAYRLLLQETYPSWLFPVKNGATTMWERWNGWTPEQGFGDITMNSYNHYAFGAVGEYLYGMVGGIQAASPGYKTIRIQPVIQEGLTWTKTSFDSIYGRIVCNWKYEVGRVTLDVTIPANTTATVYVPTRDPASVTESGTPAAGAEGLKFLRVESGAAVFSVESGTYRFVAEK
ncbi:MAG: family 78 glycoside hydrolase catalytic domain [Bacillota bacterium]